MTIALVATDMDGTLLDGEGRVPADFMPWVVAHPGIRTVIASGRQVYTLMEQFNEVAGLLTFVADNGALVMERGEVLHCDGMDPDSVRACYGIFAGVPDCTLVVCGTQNAYVLSDASPVARENVSQYYARRKFVDSLDVALAEDTIIKVAAFFEGEGAFEFLSGVPGLPAELKSVVSSAHWLDVANATVNKGAAIRAIQTRYGISPAACMAFGDYLNDLELLQACDESYCMENGVDEVKAAARHIAPANTADGVMSILRTLKQGGAACSSPSRSTSIR